MHGQQQGIVVTLDQVYAVLLEVRDAQRGTAAEVAEVKRTVADHETRLRTSEARHWPLPVATLLLAVLSVAWTIIGPRK